MAMTRFESGAPNHLGAEATLGRLSGYVAVFDLSWTPLCNAELLSQSRDATGMRTSFRMRDRP
jgi:hypothetical protein